MNSIGLYYDEYKGKYLIYTLCCRTIGDGHTLNPIDPGEKCDVMVGTVFKTIVQSYIIITKSSLCSNFVH